MTVKTPQERLSKLRFTVGESLLVFQSTVAMISIFLGFIFAGLLVILSGAVSPSRVTVWILLAAIFSLMTALFSFHLTAHQVFHFWGIFFPKSKVRTLGGITMNLGILLMFALLARLLWEKKMHLEGAVVLFFGIALLGFVLRTHIKLLKDSPHYLQVDGHRAVDDTELSSTSPAQRATVDRVQK